MCLFCRVLPSCPRNFKRTSVERYFREKGFAIDWCAFRLLVLDDNLSSQDTTAIYREVTSERSVPDQAGNSTEVTGLTPEVTQKPPENYVDLNKYAAHVKLILAENGNTVIPERTELPKRAITIEFLLAAVPAILVFIVAAITLFSILCIKRKDEPEEHWQAFTESLFLVIKVTKLLLKSLQDCNNVKHYRIASHAAK